MVKEGETQVSKPERGMRVLSSIKVLNDKKRKKN